MTKAPETSNPSGSIPPDQDQSEEALLFTQYVVDHISDAAYWADEQGRLMYVNQAACSSLGYTRAELLSMSIMDVDLGYTNAAWALFWQNTRQNGQQQIESLHIRKNGETFPVEVRADFVRFHDREYICGLARDISARKQAEEARHESEAKFGKLFHASPIAVSLTSLADGRFLEVNDAYVAMLEWTREELLGHTSLERGTWANPQQRKVMLREIHDQGQFTRAETDFRSKSGRLIHVVWAAAVVKIQEEDCLLSSIEDVTEHRRMEEAYKNERNLLRTLIDNLPDSIYLKDLQGRKILTNRADLVFTGVNSQEEVLGKTDLELYPTEVAQNAIDTEQAIIASGQPMLSQEERLINRTGEERWLLTSKIPYRDENGQIIGILGMGHDITERIKMEEALRQGEAKYRLLTESIKDVVWVMDAESLQFSYVSPSIYKQRGYTPEEIMAQPLTANFDPKIARAIRFSNIIHIADLRAGRVNEDTFFTEEVPQPCKDGSFVWTEVVTHYYFNPENGRVEVLGVSHDISQRKEMELNISLRVKELTCLSNLARLLESESIQTDELCRQTAVFLVPAMQFPELCSASIELDGRRYETGRQAAGRTRALSAPISIHGQECGRVTVTSSQANDFVLPEEQNMLANMARMLGLWLERKQAAAQVHKLTQAVEQSPLNIFITDLGNTIVYANPAFNTMTGYSLDETLGRKPYELLRDDISSGLEMDKEIAEALSSGQIWRGEFLDRNKYGETFWESALISPLRDENGRIVEYLAIEQDITQQKADRQRIAEALELNQTMQQASPVGILIYRASGECISANPAAGAILGAGPEVLMRDNFRQIRTWQSNGLLQIALQVLASGQQMTIQVHFITGFGREVRLSGSFVPFNSAGEAHLLFMFEDYTERWLAETRLMESQEKYRSLFDEAPIMIWEEDFSAVKKEFDRLKEEGVDDWRAYFESHPGEVQRLVALVRVIDVNNENLTFFGGRDRAEVISNMATLLVEESWPYFTEELIALAQGAGTFECEMPTRTMHDGELKQTFLRLSVASSQRETLAQVIVSIVDITARTQAEAALQAAHADLEARVQARTAELQTANLALEKAGRAKDEFLAAVSHELRTPLTGILGLSQALEMQLRPVISEKQMTMLQTVQKSGQRLHELINDVLDYSRLQAGEVSLQLTTFPLSHTLQSGLQELKRAALARNQQLVIRVEPADLTLLSDERRVKQIISNLLNNAIKFTPQGGRIEVTARRLPDEGQVQISVHDTGIGIQAGELGRIFEPFTQLDARLAREYGGTGLGLALVWILAGLLGGRVTVVSQPGQGSTFSLFLPG